MSTPIGFLFLVVFVKCSALPLNATEDVKEAVKLFFENTKRLNEYPVIFDIIHCLPEEVAGLRPYFEDVIKDNEENIQAAIEQTDKAWDTYLKICLPLCEHYRSVLSEEQKCAKETKFEQIQSTRNLTMREANPYVLELANFWKSAYRFIPLSATTRLEKHINEIIDYPISCIKRFVNESQAKITKLTYLSKLHYEKLMETYMEIELETMYDIQDWKLRRFSGDPLHFSFVNNCCEALLAEDPFEIGFVGAKQAADECKTQSESFAWVKDFFDVLLFF